MSKVRRSVGAVVAISATFLLVGSLIADDHGRGPVVIYPGDYVVQSGDVQASGAWRDGVSPSRVTVYPGETVVQADDLDSMGRWRIDVDPVSGSATATPADDHLVAESFESFAETKAEVSSHLNVTLIDCTNCGSGTATETRTIRVAGTFAPEPTTLTWINPTIGWPSTPSSSGNVVSVSVPGVFDDPGPYVNGQPFGFEFDVLLNPVATFSVYVDVLGDLAE